MNNIDNLYEVSEIKNQFEKLQKKYQTHLPKVDPYLVYDLLLRQQKNPATIFVYNIEVFTKQSIDTTNAAKEHIYKKLQIYSFHVLFFSVICLSLSAQVELAKN
jgi:hypothetical protein